LLRIKTKKAVYLFSRKQTIHTTKLHIKNLRRSNANDTASDSLTRISGTQGVLVAATAQIVLVGFQHQRSANNGVGANQFNQSIFNVDNSNTRFIGLNVS
jgi:hypothetical protein